MPARQMSIFKYYTQEVLWDLFGSYQMKFTDATTLRIFLIATVLGSCGSGSQIYLDGQPLISTSNGIVSADIVLDAGVHKLELRNSEKFLISGNIIGSGSLNVNVYNGGTLLLSGKQLHQATVLESGSLDIVGSGYEFGTVTVLNPGATVRRLAIPTDITSDLRAWFDASDVNTTFVDPTMLTKASFPGATVSVWKNRALPWPNATTTLGAVKRTSDMKSLIFQGGAFVIKDIYLFDQASLVAAIRPKFQSDLNPKAIFTSSLVEGIAPFSMGIGNSSSVISITPQAGLATHKQGSGWNALAGIQLDTNSEVILSGSIGPGGAQMQINGVTARSRIDMSMYQLPANSQLGRFQYYIARRWDGDNTYATDISELVVTADITSIDGMTGYIAWHNKYQDRLPYDHPYKKQPPVATITSKDITVELVCPAGKTCINYRKPLCGPLCLLGEACISNADCTSWKCTNSICAAPDCSPGCAVGAKCADKSQCSTGKCEVGFCAL